MHDLDDLFGEVPVTWPEVVAWVAEFAGITPDSPRFLPYVRAWRVADKIAQARAWSAFQLGEVAQRHASNKP